MRRISFLFFALVMLCGAPSVFADQTSVERMLKENKNYLEFLDTCITNLGDKEVDPFFEVCEMQFNADISFLQSDYSRAFKYIYASQGKQIPIYVDVLSKYYLEESKSILDKIAPNVIKSKNAPARLYLTLGYRDRAISRNTQTVADASHPRLYSDKLYKYMEAIKIARRSMRYAFLALFESRDIETKKYIYSHLIEIEREGGNVFYTRFLNKTGEPFNAELVISFDDYEKRFQQEMEERKNKPVDDKLSPDKKTPPAPAFERKVEREVRFRQERRVAEYIRDAEFSKADDIISKYVDDFSFKLIEAAIEVLSVKDKDSLGLDYNRAKIHHADNYARLTKPSVYESFASKLKVRDDISKKTD
ncbi:MAG TPA: hypothetical protein VF857_06215, partial [Spirochaetota bacterium]